MGTDAVLGIVTPAQHVPSWSPVLQAVVPTAAAVFFALLVILLLYCFYIRPVSRRMKTSPLTATADAEKEERAKKVVEEGGDRWRECFVSFPDPSGL